MCLCVRERERGVCVCVCVCVVVVEYLCVWVRLRARQEERKKENQCIVMFKDCCFHILHTTANSSVLTLKLVLALVLTRVLTHCPHTYTCTHIRTYSWAYTLLLGGFIWDFVDQGLLLKGERGGYGYGYGGDYGDLPNTKQFCINGILGEWNWIVQILLYLFYHILIYFD